MIALFLFGLFVSLIVALACGLIGYGIYTENQSLLERDDSNNKESSKEDCTDLVEEEYMTPIEEEYE